MPSCTMSVCIDVPIPLSAISAAILVMIRELESACEAAFATLSRTPWATVKLVSGQSAYVADLLGAIEQVAETVKPLVEQKKYLRNFFDKAARSVTTTAGEMRHWGSHVLIQCTPWQVYERIGQKQTTTGDRRGTGQCSNTRHDADPDVAHQLLIDLQALKACLLKIPGEALSSSKCVSIV